MENKLEKIVIEILKNNIYCSSILYTEEKGIQYVFNGFSKSGTANIYQKDDKIICETRYNQIDYIETFRDFVNVAWRWYLNYKNREPFTYPDEEFEPFFIEYGLLLKEEIKIFKYKVI